MPDPYGPRPFVSRLPQPPAWSSPEGLYGFILQSVPGISPEAASWLHSRILGGQSVVGDSAAAQAGGLSLAQLSAINALQPFSAGAPESGFSGLPMPAGPPAGTPGMGWGPGGTVDPGPPPGVNIDHQPPIISSQPILGGPVLDEADPVVQNPASSMPPVLSYPQPTMSAYPHVTGHFPSDAGPGGAIAEQYLGLPAPSVTAPRTSPVDYLQAPRFRL